MSTEKVNKWVTSGEIAADEIAQYLRNQKLTEDQIKDTLLTLTFTDDLGDEERHIRELRNAILVRLIEGDRTRAGTKTFATAFLEFLDKQPEWIVAAGSPSYQSLGLEAKAVSFILRPSVYSSEIPSLAAVIFFETYKDRFQEGSWLEQKDFLVIRKQSYRTSYRHAVVTLLHYHIVINSLGKARPMADVSRSEAMREGNDLFLFLRNCGGEGGPSLDFLYECMSSVEGWDHTLTKETVFDTLAVPGKYSVPKVYESNCEALMEAVATYPLLLTEMKVEREFVEDNGLWSYNKTPKADQFTGEFHSMVVIGMRKAVSIGSAHKHDYYFLLQNNQIGKYIVECSATYLSACGAKITRVMNTKITEYPPMMPTCSTGCDFYETCVADCEAPIPEKKN